MKPKAHGLYDPAFEHDACGVAFVARLDARSQHEVVVRALAALERLEHRGAAGADAETGDGAGILVQLPHAFLARQLDLPAPGQYGVAVCFLPRDQRRREELEELLASTVAGEGQEVIGWRDVPVVPTEAGATAQLHAPRMRQLFIRASGALADDREAFERKLYVIRRVAEQLAGADLAVPSCSARTIVYKGMLTAPQLRR